MTSELSKEEKSKLYPKTELFSVKGTLGVPHPYTIGPRLVGHCADHNGGILNKRAIEDAEKVGIHCVYPKCTLSHGEHKTALTINCKTEDPELLKEYLMSIKDQCEKDGFAGFALVKDFE